jgi:hAT family C-terminal dimerisation region
MQRGPGLLKVCSRFTINHNQRKWYLNILYFCSLLYPNADQLSEIVTQTFDFIGKRGAFDSSHLAWRLAGPKMKLSALEWWTMNFSEGEGQSLRSLALRILTIPASSAASERNWSSFGYILDNKRNRLTPERATKLVYLYSNLRLISHGKRTKLLRVEESEVEREDVVETESED